MSDKTEGRTPVQGRRAFLKGALAAGTATTVAAVVVGGGAPVREAEAAAAPGAGTGSKGYRESEHVQDYYRTARL
ncbi:MAG: hypothetical protein PHF72_00065 [Gammaproteobacteria bacterium]|nr:hypothetical protein [Gammaproteobacteria bacterium]